LVTIEFRGRLEDLPLPVLDANDKSYLANMMVMGVWNDTFVTSKSDQGTPVLIHSMEFEGPFTENWPPASHKAIFGNASKGSSEAQTKEIFKNFMTKAYRRTPLTSEVEKMYKFWSNIKGDYTSYEESVKEVLVAILCSPNFLYIAEPLKDTNAKDGEKPLNDFQLASRLSYFLWNSMPDSELITLAEKGTLRQNLSAQIKRMIQDQRSWSFVQSFSEQWLDMDSLNRVNINIKQYPEFTRFVKEDMRLETYHFFNEVLKNDLSIMNFVDSDFAMLNQNLAQFYKIPGVKGSYFRKVPVSTSLQRGGLLSQGSFLTGHSNGEDSHPIKRGVWLIKKILDNPPPKPPPNVPEIDLEDPKFQKLTIIEQLQVHRDKDSCRDCHKRIDPFGIVFENYDAVGMLRNEVKVRDQKTNKYFSAKLITEAEVPDGTKVNGIAGIKSYILSKKQEDVNRSVSKHLLSYALGRSLSFTDDSTIKAIMKKTKDNGYKIQPMIEAIVTSELFLKK
jgi:hypothetical protein